MRISLHAKESPWGEIQEVGDVRFKASLEGNKYLTLSLKILHEGDLGIAGLWGVKGKIVLSKENQMLSEHNIEMLVLETGETRWLGVWNNIFIRECISENCEDIPLNELGDLANRTLMDIHAYPNQINFTSLYLEPLTETD